MMILICLCKPLLILGVGFYKAEASCLLVNHLDMLEKIKIKDDYNFQHKMLNFVARKMGVRIDYETECYIEQ
jgi:hypothetical protein